MDRVFCAAKIGEFVCRKAGEQPVPAGYPEKILAGELQVTGSGLVIHKKMPGLLIFSSI